jgi:hypothetical protein
MSTLSISDQLIAAQHHLNLAKRAYFSRNYQSSLSNINSISSVLSSLRFSIQSECAIYHPEELTRK